MRLSARQAQIVRFLSRNDGGGVVSLDDLSKVLGVSIRTLYNDVNAINDCLAGCNVGALRVASRSVDCGRVDWSRVSSLR